MKWFVAWAVLMSGVLVWVRLLRGPLGPDPHAEPEPCPTCRGIDAAPVHAIVQEGGTYMGVLYYTCPDCQTTSKPIYTDPYKPRRSDFNAALSLWNNQSEWGP